jgi:hypothetical protein
MSRIGQMSGERTDARKADGRSERQTDGEDQQKEPCHSTSRLDNFLQQEESPNLED